jgi:hypothetical protein
MYCEVTLLRRSGRKLKRHELGAPLQGDLTFDEMPQPTKAFPRAMRVLNLYEPFGMNKRTAMTLMEPQFAGIEGQAICFKGVELVPREDGIYEHAQAWLVTPILVKA